MVIYLTGISTKEPLYINQELSLSFIGNMPKCSNIDNIKPIRKDITNEFLKQIINKNSLCKIVEMNKKPTYTLVKIEVTIDNIVEDEFEKLIQTENILQANNPIKKMFSSTQTYISSLTSEKNQYVIDFKKQKGCFISNIFNDFEDATSEQLKKINKLPCIFDSRILLPELNKEEYADGCIHFCAKSVLDQHPGIKKKVIERFLRYVDRGIYDKLIDNKNANIELPKLISDKELEYMSNFQSQNIESLEKRFNLKNSSSKQTIENKKKNLVVFNGNNLNPLPMELFSLWQTIISDYKKFIERFKINETIVSQWDIIALKSQEDFHYEGLTEKERMFLFPFNSSIVMSLYTDEDLGQELFYISIQCPPMDIETFNNRNQITLPADEYLKYIYYYWKKFKESNPKKYNKEFKQPTVRNINKITQFAICENCLMSDSCDRTNCYLSKDDFDFLINKNNKFNLHIHKLYSPMLTTNEWKQIIDNLTATIDVYQFNICGDEPLLFDGLVEITKYIKNLGINCSLETSGLLLTDKWLQENLYLYDEITISVDSFDDDACAILGKLNKDEKYLTIENISELVKKIKESHPNCKTSIETKVMQINKHEKMSNNIEILSTQPEEWKIVKYEVTDNDFMYFINKNFTSADKIYDSIPGLKIIIEDETNNYSFIDNNGVLCKKVNKRKKEIIDIATETFVEDIKKQKIKIFDD